MTRFINYFSDPGWVPSTLNIATTPAAATNAEPPMVDAELKELRLREIVRSFGEVVVAFSGGVDSSYLALIATQELGDKALCITGDSASLAEHARTAVVELAQSFGLNHQIAVTAELDRPGYVANSPQRCYFCKSELYETLGPLAREQGIEIIVDGSTVDDLGDHRPGRQAAGENAVRSPLIEAGFTKSDVRLMSRRAGLPTWDQPASPCLSSRIAYGIPVTPERLLMIERGEAILRKHGFREFRVRHHDEIARLEISPNEFDRVLDRKLIDELAEQFRAIGFRYVTLDLHGFRSGALNEIMVPLLTRIKTSN